MNQDNSDKQGDIFAASIVYPEAKTIFAARPEPIQTIKDTCFVVLDTNVLLIPYTISPKNLKEIKDTYSRIAINGRLLVPGQVAREFARNRATKLSELHQQLSRKKSKATRLHGGRYPLLDAVPEYQRMLELEKAIDEQIKEYQKAITEVIGHVRSWNWNDPVSLLYSDLFTEKTIFEPSISRDDLEADLVRRQKFKIPPGYKDASKNDSGIGDVLIWHSILELGQSNNRSVLFVSGDEKADWWHQSEGQALYPRFELVEEFRRKSEGHSFHIQRFSDFLDLFGAESQVVEEVRRGEAIAKVRVSEHGALQEQWIRTEKAVYEWLNDQYPSAQIEVNVRSFPDFKVITDKGVKIGVEVKYFNRVSSGMLISRLRDTVLRGYYESNEGDIDEFMMVLGSRDKKSASELSEAVQRFISRYPSSPIYVGYLDEDGHFVDIFRS